MSDETPPSPFDRDFDAIEAAVLETARGRWFLGEFARRNRATETDKLFAAIQRLERSADDVEPSALRAETPAERRSGKPHDDGAPVEVRQNRAPHDEGDKPTREVGRPALEAVRQEASALRADLAAILDGVASANAAMLAINPGTAGQIVAPDAKGIDRVIANPSDASATILAAAELIQEQVWLLREGGAAPRLCDALDRGATQIFAACAFGELAGRRAVAVLHALAGLNERAREVAARSGLPAAPFQAAAPKSQFAAAARDNDIVFAPPEAAPPSPRNLPPPRAARASGVGAVGSAKPPQDRPPRPATLADIDALAAREKLRLFT